MKDTDDKRWHLSCFLRVFENGGLVALIHLLQPDPVYLSKELWHNIASDISVGVKPTHSIVSELVVQKLLIDDSEIDQQTLMVAREQVLRSLSRPTILYLMMAQGCNFSCSYCPIPALAKHYGERMLSFEDGIAGIVLWQKHIEEYPPDSEPYFLIFYGGEPLLNREVLEHLLPYVSEKQSMGQLPKKLELMLCTNGSLMDASISRLLASYNVTVAIGVDGPQEHNDRIRITNNGNATFLEIKKVVKLLTDNGVRVVASVTITPTNVHHLAEYPAFLHKLGISQFGFNLMKGHALIHELDGKSAEEYCRVAARGVLSGLTDVNENGECYEYQLEKKLTALRNGLPFSVDCTCYGNQLVVQADGQVSNCPFLRIDQGHVGKLPGMFKIDQTETVKRWRQRIPIFNDSIKTDSKNGLLDGGGCAWSCLELYGDTVAQDINSAIFAEEVTNELIWYLLPTEMANALRQEKATYWNHRWVGHLHIARTGDN